MALLHLQYQAEALSQLNPHNSPIWFRMLALKGDTIAFGVYYSSFGLMSYLFERCETEAMATILNRRRWRWIGQSLVKKLPFRKHWTFTLDTRREKKEGG